LEKQYKYVSFKERLLYLDEEEVMSFMRYLHLSKLSKW